MISNNTTSSTETLAVAKAANASQEKLKKLRQVSDQFEAILIGNMLKAMRETIPEGGVFKRGIEMDIFENMFDDEISDRMSARHQIGFSDMVFRQLAGKLQLGEPVEEILKQMKEVQSEARKAARPINEKMPGVSLQDLHSDESNYDEIINQAASKFKLDPLLLKAVIKQESAGDPNAISSKGAKGLMQLIDSTAVMMGVQDVFDPQQNIMGGAGYLKHLLDRFDNNIELALASYNAGPGNVERYGGIPPYKETQNYVQKVLKNYNQLKDTDDG